MKNTATQINTFIKNIYFGNVNKEVGILKVSMFYFLVLHQRVHLRVLVTIY